MAVTRGIRNNNPGNIDRNPANKWQGRMRPEQMTPDQRAEKRFEVFATPQWGIRAMCVLLISYFDRHGCDTVRKVISRWAPPKENDTDAYVNAVAKAVGVPPDEWINVHEYRRLHPLVVAIIRHENGVQPYNPDVIEEGLRLAGVVKTNAAPLVAVPKAATAAAATAAAATGAGAVAELVNSATQPVQQLMPAISQFNELAWATSALPSWLRAAASLVVLVAAAASVFTWYRLRRARKAAQS